MTISASLRLSGYAQFKGEKHRTFHRAGTLTLSTTVTTLGTTNGINDLDLSLVSGDPWVTAGLGAIRFVTNTALLPPGSAANAQLDVARKVSIGQTGQNSYSV